MCECSLTGVGKGWVKRERERGCTHVLERQKGIRASIRISEKEKRRKVERKRRKRGGKGETGRSGGRER